MPLPLLCIIFILSACSTPAPPKKIALLAPFEGQYRDIGYEALYGAQLSLKDSQLNRTYGGYSLSEGYYNSDLIILPLDDGGTEVSARERAQALTYDPSIVFVLAVGPYSTALDVQNAYGDLPVLLVGYWPSIPQHDNIAALTADFRDVLPTVPDFYASQDTPLIGGEILSLSQFDHREGPCTIWTSEGAMQEGFRERYRQMSPFAPPPRLISSAAYSAVFVGQEVLQAKVSIRDVQISGESVFNDQGYLRGEYEAIRHEYSCELLR